MNIGEIEERIGYSFQNADHLRRALTSTSFAKEHNDRIHSSSKKRLLDYGGLATLGDAVLDTIIAEELMARGINDKGDISQIRSQLVREETQFDLWEELGIELAQLWITSQEEHRILSGKKAMFEHLFEALVGAVFLDGGYDKARERSLAWYSSHMDRIQHVV